MALDHARRAAAGDERPHGDRAEISRPATGSRTTALRGHALGVTGAHDEAHGEYQLALQIHPEDSPSWFPLAQTHTQLGSLAEAADALTHVDPDEAGAKDLRADLAA